METHLHVFQISDWFYMMSPPDPLKIIRELKLKYKQAT